MRPETISGQVFLAHYWEVKVASYHLRNKQLKHPFLICDLLWCVAVFISMMCTQIETFPVSERDVAPW